MGTLYIHFTNRRVPSGHGGIPPPLPFLFGPILMSVGAERKGVSKGEKRKMVGKEINKEGGGSGRTEKNRREKR